MAVAGLVLGILAAVTSFLPIINNLSAILAVVGGILSLVALIGAVKKSKPMGMAVAGLVLAILSFAVVLATQAMYSQAIDSAVDEMENGSKPVSSEQVQETSDDSDKTEDAPADDEEDWSHLSMGESVTFENGLSVVVNSAERVQESYSDDTVLRVSVTYVNNGDSSVSFNEYDWKCEDANGVQTGPAFTVAEGDDLSSGTLTSGGTVTGDVFFDGEPIRVLYFSNILQRDSNVAWDVA